MPPSAPLAPGYREAPFWHDHLAEPTGTSPLPGRADVLVVGAGYCGLTAAAELARRGRHAVVVEAGGLGNGASTRNGGMVIPELKHGLALLERRHGPSARPLADAVHEAFALVERVVREQRIDCDYERGGGLLLAHHPRQVPGLRDLARELVDVFGDEARVVERDALSDEIGSARYFGALMMEKTAGLHPARYHAGLLRAALDAGVDVHEQTRVHAVESGSGAFRVRTERGVVTAPEVLVAANAYVDGAFPDLRRHVLPVGSFIVATEPLAPDLASGLIPHRRMCFDTRHFVRYWRVTRDHRLLFGGRAGLAPASVTRARDVLYRELLRTYPQLAGTRITHAWGGNVAITRDRLPHAGRLGGVAFATGCNGTGVALSTWFGVKMADWISGGEPPVFAEVPFPSIPLHRLRGAWLPAVGWGLRALDRLGR